MEGRRELSCKEWLQTLEQELAQVIGEDIETWEDLEGALDWLPKEVAERLRKAKEEFINNEAGNPKAQLPVEQHVIKWSVEELASWLRENGLSQRIVDVLVNQQVDGATFMYLRLSDLGSWRM